MKKAVKIFFIYLMVLFAGSLVFSLFKFASFHVTILGVNQKFSSMLPLTIVAGIVALKYTVASRALKIFLIVYIFLWLLRFVLLYFSSRMGEVHFFSRSIRLDIIIPNYYSTVSRLETPMPFIIFWLINYFFMEEEKKEEK